MINFINTDVASRKYLVATYNGKAIALLTLNGFEIIISDEITEEQKKEIFLKKKELEARTLS